MIPLAIIPTAPIAAAMIATVTASLLAAAPVAAPAAMTSLSFHIHPAQSRRRGGRLVTL